MEARRADFSEWRPVGPTFPKGGPYGWIFQMEARRADFSEWRLVGPTVLNGGPYGRLFRMKGPQGRLMWKEARSADLSERRPAGPTLLNKLGEISRLDLFMRINFENFEKNAKNFAFLCEKTSHENFFTRKNFVSEKLWLLKVNKKLCFLSGS